MQKIIIVGKGGSGKDYLRDKFVSKGFNRIVSYTTRPPRECELNDIDYKFISEKEFEEMINKKLFYEYDNFNGWYYGTSFKDWYNANIFIMTPKGISKILHQDRKNCFIIYLDIIEYTRRKRLMKRNDADSTERRVEADRKDFSGFKDYDMRVTNGNF